ncbi:hypothetical protein CCAX7_58670 [Capsulimonas corticalis]|uniref:Uncharacterized protein n=1 Tax=Capsulimonas corticalis TaxID=2219043 RepID=A0A402D013_9BACT|nr:hypothetical protein [Capsulimonas corticalis]BDI33816.1 hypothetical protein CCAX7_58670 [Capsulimonas corticalis]
MKTQRTLTPWTIASFFAVPLTLVLSAAAAQAADGVVPPISVQVGVGYLTDSSARNAAGDAGLHAGLSYGLPNKSLLSTLHGKPSIDVDYNHTGGHGGRVDVLGFSYTERISVGNAVTDVVTSGARPYVGLGIGAFRTDVKRRTTTTTTTSDSGNPGSGNPGTIQTTSGTPGVNSQLTTTTTSSQSANGWSLGGKILAGVDFGKTYIEASYQIGGSKLGVRSDTANLSVGVHF